MVSIPTESIQLWRKLKFLQLSDILYRSIVKRFEILSGKEFASKVINFSAYKATKEILDSEKLIGDDLQKFLQAVIETTASGKIIECEIGKEVGGIVQVKGSLEAKAYGPSDTPVCYLSQGIIKAFAEKIVGKSVETKERKCVAMGNDYCEFAIIVGG